jgi:hypothetical protein
MGFGDLLSEYQLSREARWVNLKVKMELSLSYKYALEDMAVSRT